MDPNLFHLDWDRVAEVLGALVVLSFFVERALAIIFESRWFLKKLDQFPIKEFIAFGVSLLVCITWHFDSLSMVLLTDHTSLLGEIVTAGVVAGGSKASLKLFHDVLNVRSSAHERVYPENSETKKPDPTPDAAAREAL